MNNKKRMGVDLDGVVYQFVEQFDKLIKSKGYSVDRTRYDRGLSREVLIPILNENKKNHIFRHLPEYNNAVATLNKLSNKYDLYLITARTSGFLDTINRIHESKLNYTQIIFSGDKGKEAKRLKLDAFIEDSYDNALNIIEGSNAKVFLLNAEYNQTRYDAKGIQRISDLEEII